MCDTVGTCVHVVRRHLHDRLGDGPMPFLGANAIPFPFEGYTLTINATTCGARLHGRHGLQL